MFLVQSKKGELILLSMILLVVIITGLLLLQQQLENQKYIGNNLNNIAYKLDSTNPNCHIQNLRINTSNVILFKDENQVKTAGFRIDQNCS